MTALLKKYWLLKACARRRERTHDLAPRPRLAMGRAWMLSGLGLTSVHPAWVRLMARCELDELYRTCLVKAQRHKDDRSTGRWTLRRFFASKANGACRPECPKWGLKNGKRTLHGGTCANGSFVPISLQKSEVAGRRIFLRKTRSEKQPLIRIVSVALPKSPVSLT
jgi:hypothetical protein